MREAGRMKKKKAKSKRRTRKGEGGRGIKEKTIRSKIVICGRSGKRCLGIPRNAGKLGDWGDCKIWRFGRWGKIIICGKK